MKTLLISLLALIILVLVVAAVWTVFGSVGKTGTDTSESDQPGRQVGLPAPNLEGRESLERLISQRRSVRDYEQQPLQLEEIGQILWAAQGITDAQTGFRTVPSAGALYPLELFLVVGSVDSLTPAVYRYLPAQHQLEEVRPGDQRTALYEASLEQKAIRQAPVSLLVAAVYERTTVRYGDRGKMYVHIEAGHVGQNIYLQAGALGLATVAIGAFHDDRVKTIIGLADSEIPLYLFPIGRPIQADTAQ